MKKFFLFTLVLCLFLTACGGSAEPVETTPATTKAPTTAPTEAPTDFETVSEVETVVVTDEIPQPPSVEELLLQDKNATILETDDWGEYTSVLTEMGFIEPRLGITTHESSIAPRKMVYDETSFYMEFDAILFNPEITYESGWVMVGTKATAEETNITALNFDNYSLEFCETFRGQDAASDRARRVLGENYPRLTDYRYYRMVDPTLEILDREVVAYATEYYPTTNNLYNYYCISTIGLNDMGPLTTNIQIMRHWDEIIDSQWAAARAAGQLYQFGFGELGTEHFYGYFCEPGMTLVDWANSVYNIDGWIFTDDHIGWLHHPETKDIIMIGYTATGERYVLEDVSTYSLFSREEAKALGFTP